MEKEEAGGEKAAEEKEGGEHFKREVRDSAEGG